MKRGGGSAVRQGLRHSRTETEALPPLGQFAQLGESQRVEAGKERPRREKARINCYRARFRKCRVNADSCYFNVELGGEFYPRSNYASPLLSSHRMVSSPPRVRVDPFSNAKSTTHRNTRERAAALVKAARVRAACYRSVNVRTRDCPCHAAAS